MALETAVIHAVVLNTRLEQLYTLIQDCIALICDVATHPQNNKQEKDDDTGENGLKLIHGTAPIRRNATHHTKYSFSLLVLDVPKPKD